MEVGVQMIFQSWGYGDEVSDGQVYDEEIRLGVLAEELGFDALWPVEHHFHDYSFCPDNTQFLSYMAARTQRIKLGTGAVILPWNHPLRVAEKISLLDHLCDGRTIFGMGRGLSRREYEPFGLPMDESRERFDEASAMVLEALETGFIEGDGKYYQQPRAELRPRPKYSFKGRTSAVAMSPESAEQAAKLGVRMVVFSQRQWDEQVKSFENYRRIFREQHQTEPAAPICCDFTYCDEDAGRAREVAEKHIPGYLLSVMEHYELDSDHFKKAKGYENYGKNVDLIRHLGLDGMSKAYLEVQAWGTPDQILEKLEARRKLIGDFELVLCFRYAGLPYEMVEKSMRLFAGQVMPALKEWNVSRSVASAVSPAS